MTDSKHQTDAERKALSGLSKETQPPEFLEDRIVAELKRKNLISDSSTTKRLPFFKYAYMAVAASLILALGIEIGSMQRVTTIDNSVARKSRQFMLLLYETPGVFQQIPIGREAEVMAEYGAWAKSLAETGVNIDGEKLTESGSKLFGIGDDVKVSAVSPAQGKRLLAGYFAIEVENFERALEISERCPHLKYGGEIELREVQLTTHGDSESSSQ